VKGVGKKYYEEMEGLIEEEIEVNAENGNRRTKKRRQHNLVGTIARGVS